MTTDPPVIFTGHSQLGSETIQGQKWHTWLTKGGRAKALTPLHLPESSSLAEAQERAFLFLRQRPDLVRRWLFDGWSIHHMPAETGITLSFDRKSVIQEGA